MLKTLVPSGVDVKYTRFELRRRTFILRLIFRIARGRSSSTGRWALGAGVGASLQNYTRNEWRRCENYTRNWYRRFENYTRNEWRRCENTLETSGEDVTVAWNRCWSPHFLEVEGPGCLLLTCRSCWQYTRNEWRRCKNTLGTSGEDHPSKFALQTNRISSLHISSQLLSTTFETSMVRHAQPTPEIYTRNECNFHIFSTRFECSFHIFSTRFECIFFQPDLSIIQRSPDLQLSKRLFSPKIHSGRAQIQSDPTHWQVLPEKIHSFRV